MNKIGVMQGRLTPPIKGKIQAFPWDTWKQEFRTATDLGFDEIEFIFESEDYKNNPIYTPAGLKEIEKLTKDTGVLVRYVCADYFMEKPFVRVPEKERTQNIEILKTLIAGCASIGVVGIEIPLVDNSRLTTPEEKRVFVESLDTCLPAAEEHNMQLGLETSLGPEEFKELLEKIDNPLVVANYDTGNSSSLGYDPKEELTKYGKWIRNIHIKDRVLGGSTVPLGQGDADFDLFFKTLGKLGYNDSFILQAARQKDDLAAAREYKAFVIEYIRRYL
jgi:L-ribulose-5-phosphate 3-epimerase